MTRRSDPTCHLRSTCLRSLTPAAWRPREGPNSALMAARRHDARSACMMSGTWSIMHGPWMPRGMPLARPSTTVAVAATVTEPADCTLPPHTHRGAASPRQQPQPAASPRPCLIPLTSASLGSGRGQQALPPAPFSPPPPPLLRTDATLHGPTYPHSDTLLSHIDMICPATASRPLLLPCPPGLACSIRVLTVLACLLACSLEPNDCLIVPSFSQLAPPSIIVRPPALRQPSVTSAPLRPCGCAPDGCPPTNPRSCPSSVNLGKASGRPALRQRWRWQWRWRWLATSPDDTLPGGQRAYMAPVVPVALRSYRCGCAALR